jgi:predicted nucleic acid-binding Zn ribbon protein
MSFRQPQHIGDVLSKLLARRGYARVQSAEALTDAWQRAAGEKRSRQTRATAVRRGVVEVLVANSTLVQEMTFDKADLLRRLCELLPDETIRDLKFRVGPVT